MNISSLLKKIFTYKEQRNHQKNPIVVVDVGCRWGFAERFLSNDHANNFKIYGFDPDQEECQRLQASYQYLPPGFVTCIPWGVAGANGRRNLHITKEPACCSLHEPIPFLAENYPALDCIRPQQIVEVDVTTLKQWADENDINIIDYIKIDTQGSELEILKGADDFLHLTRCIDIEVEFNPIYEGQTLFGETDTYLRSKGFMLWRLSNLVHYSLGGTALPLEEPNTICFDNNHRQEVQAYGGQLFWADAKYIHSDVFKKCNTVSVQTQRDIMLFSALGMSDIVDHIERMKYSK
ncbi:MAG: FkbM family methyltransferase [Methylococcales bacterium]|nr:FkbM family methyltransferase [Methylococcales bacterium]